VKQKEYMPISAHGYLPSNKGKYDQFRHGQIMCDNCA